jgi:hypothetical protein
VNKQAASLAQRRAELVEQCAHQRAFLAQECASLRAPLGGGGLSSYLRAHKATTLALAGAALGLLATRPKKLLSFAAAGLSMWKLARRMLPLLSRLRGD